MVAAAFSQALARGLSPSGATKTGSRLVPQTKGDPNYYATTPSFDSRGFWHAAGSNPPPKAPTGAPITPSEGEWLQQGTASRNGQSTSFWVWYPPQDKTITFGKQAPGEHNYLVSRKRISSAKHVFSGPEYWVHEFVVPALPQSSYSPQSLEYVTVEGIVPVVGTFHCSRWLLVASQNSSRLNATMPGGLFKPGAVFNFYGKYVGVSPYFTWHGYLFKFEYTGYDAKTGKYRQGTQYTYTISMCVDGMNVQKNPSGDIANYTVYASGGGSGGVLVVKGVGQMESAFSVRGLGKSSRGDSAFSSALSRGLGHVPEGLGQLSQFSAGGNGTATLVAYAASAIPKVDAQDWVEFYPNDPDQFRPNTNLAMAAWEQSSSLGGSSFYGANPIGGAILSQVITTTLPGDTAYWSLTDPNHRAVYTVGTNSNQSGDGSSPGIAIIRSTYSVAGKVKLEIALRTIPLRPDQFPGWPSKATLVAASSVPSNLDWAQESGPVGGNLTASLMPGQPIALAAGGTDFTAVLNSFLKFISQAQFLRSIPSTAWGAWAGWGVARGGPLTVPTVYFTYGGQTYKVYWYGHWINGQVGGAPNSGPAISVAIVTPKPKTPPPAWLTPVAVPYFPPVHGPARPPSPTPPSTSVPVTAGGSAPVPAVTAPAISASSLSPGMAVALGLVGAGVLGGVLYLVFE